jgi:hypothetical protein
MTRDEARALWASSGLNYSVLTTPNLRRLVILLGREMKVSDLFRGTYRMHRSLGLRRDGAKTLQAQLRCKAFYFDNREAVTFGSDGFIGFAGWSDEKNVVPILKGFRKWVAELQRAGLGDQPVKTEVTA